VVGGGIAGIAAALRLRDNAPNAEITIFEQSDRLGGKLRTGSLAGSALESGAEAFLVRDATGGESAAVALARRAGLAEALVHPAAVPAALVVGGELRDMPRGTLMGVPGDPQQVADVVRLEVERDRDDGHPLLGSDDDVAVGELVRRRLGDAVVERLVDPMLGGVYAGRADQLSLAVTMPGLARTARTEHTLTGAVRAALSAAPRPTGPVFATVAGGLSRLVAAAAEASGARIRLNATVRELSPDRQGWRLVVGPAQEPEVVWADAVVLALPARPAARLLTGVDPGVAELVGALDYASIALVSLALPDARLPELSGFLVPAEEGMLVKAATFFTRKWPHLRRSDGVALVRASVGRYGEKRSLQRSDDELIEAVWRDLSALLGSQAVPAPLAAQVQRWDAALPQYGPGHLDRVAAARARLRSAHPTLALAGAGYDGVGIPLCVRSGERAAEEIVTVLTGLRP
jgi:protoporphyrinogen/coproporphyrinogen III oxidase